MAVSSVTMASGVALLSGEPLPLVGKSNWAPSMPNSSISKARSAASAPSMVRWPSVTPKRLSETLAPRFRLTLSTSLAFSA